MQAKTTEYGSRFHERLGQLIAQRYDGKWTRLAQAAGISLGTFQRYANGSGLPGVEQLLRICEAAGVTADWLLRGRGESSPGEIAEEPVLYLPRLDVEVSAGEGSIVELEHITEYQPFRPQDLKRLAADPKQMVVVQVRGESMQPTLQPGDDLVVDLSPGQTVVDGIWCVRIDDTLMVKRLEHLPGNCLRVRSDNPAYQGFEVQLDKAPDFWIIGRVLWHGRRL